ncbi:MAG TPA: acetate--CoA ligase family protein [Syntrophobacteria bacterium]|nr:acetate--CoA ligase family protein [Syntrophobacteria bacterium]
MRGFFYPESVAVIGVSPSLTNLGRAIAYHLFEFRYTGRVYLVGPNGGSFLGHTIYRSLHEGVCGQTPADRAALVAVITRISQVLCDLPEIGEIDVNPMKVLAAGRGCVAVDCRIVLTPAGQYWQPVERPVSSLGWP